MPCIALFGGCSDEPGSKSVGSHSMNKRCQRVAVMLLAVIGAVLTTVSQAAPIMSAGPYTIVSDAVLAGTAPMTAGNYRVVATVGEATATEPAYGFGFRMFPGFWQVERLIPLCTLDVDGNGLVEPAFDGLLIARALSGIRGPALVLDALGVGAQYTGPAQILGRINLDALDVDGDRTSSGTTDGMIIVRAMAGVANNSVVGGASAPGATRTSWAQIRTHLNTRCGATFPP